MAGKVENADKDARYQVDSLQMLCREVLLISRANDWDLGFLQGILHKESCQLQQFQHITNEEYG